MQSWAKGGKILFIGSLLTFSCVVAAPPAEAFRAHDIVHRLPGRDTLAREAEQRGNATRPHHAVRTAHANSKHPLAKNAKAHYNGSTNLQCVPFARAASGIELKGNAVNWWDAADGVYQRGHRPETGSVLNFRATGQMRLGHVAVVRRVLDPRQVEIDQANWVNPSSKGNITRGTRVVDVSERNDWSAVRVQLAGSAEFGSVYPTYGFIYDRPDNGVTLANTRALRPALPALEVAEAPDAAPVASQPLHHSLLDFNSGSR
jgi:surface antigen